MYLNDVQIENVRRALKGIELKADAINRKLHDKSVNSNRVAIEELRSLTDYALEQLK